MIPAIVRYLLTGEGLSFLFVTDDNLLCNLGAMKLESAESAIIEYSVKSEHSDETFDRLNLAFLNLLNF